MDIRFRFMGIEQTPCLRIILFGSKQRKLLSNQKEEEGEQCMTKIGLHATRLHKIFNLKATTSPDNIDGHNLRDDYEYMTARVGEYCKMWGENFKKKINQ